MGKYKLEFYLLKMATNSALFLGYINDKDKLVSMSLYNNLQFTPFDFVEMSTRLYIEGSVFYTKLTVDDAMEYLEMYNKEMYSIFKEITN